MNSSKLPKSWPRTPEMSSFAVFEKYCVAPSRETGTLWWTTTDLQTCKTNLPLNSKYVFELGNWLLLSQLIQDKRSLTIASQWGNHEQWLSKSLFSASRLSPDTSEHHCLTLIQSTLHSWTMNISSTLFTRQCPCSGKYSLYRHTLGLPWLREDIHRWHPSDHDEDSHSQSYMTNCSTIKSTKSDVTYRSKKLWWHSWNCTNVKECTTT
jgi:hypothetical protein